MLNLEALFTEFLKEIHLIYATLYNYSSQPSLF